MKKKVKNSRVVGIDLGTTFTEVAYYDDSGKPTTIPNVDGEFKTPSVVYFGPGLKEIHVGAAACSMLFMEPQRTFCEFKRDVGTDRVYLREQGQEITPPRCQIELLKYIRKSIIHYFGDELAGDQAVISVPAYFGEKERQSTIYSAEMAGIKVLALLNEPTAAGLAHGLNEKQGERLVLIADLGGGTFDTSIVLYNGADVTVLSTYGDKQLGGKDVDDVLMRLITDAFQRQHAMSFTAESHPADWFNVREDVIRQKHRLSSCTKVELVARIDGKQVNLSIDRGEFSNLLTTLMDKAEKVMREAIRDAKIDPKEITLALPVGGSSRLLPFRDRLEGLVGAARIAGGTISPDLAIAEGAAIHAAKLVVSGGQQLVGETFQAIPAPPMRHTDVVPHSLGIAVADRVSGAECCSVILEKNRPLPCQATRSYGSVDDAQSHFKVQTLQGESKQPASDCLSLAEIMCELPPRSSNEPTLEITMGYDSSGMVKLLVKDLISGKIENVTVDFYSKKSTAPNSK